MEAWDIFDAETPDLQAELRRIQGALAGAAPEPADGASETAALVLPP